MFLITHETKRFTFSHSFTSCYVTQRHEEWEEVDNKQRGREEGGRLLQIFFLVSFSLPLSFSLSLFFVFCFYFYFIVFFFLSSMKCIRCWVTLSPFAGYQWAWDRVSSVWRNHISTGWGWGGLAAKFRPLRWLWWSRAEPLAFHLCPVDPDTLSSPPLTVNKDKRSAWLSVNCFFLFCFALFDSA